MPRLQVLNGKRQGAIFEIEARKEMVIGHRQSADITIDDPWVSWDHARVVYDLTDATCWIEDMNSTNGTFVNCERVNREQLRHEDIVFLGKTHVIFLAPIEEHSQALFEHSSPSTTHAPKVTPPAALHVSSAQGFMQGSGKDPLGQSSGLGPESWSSEGSRSKGDPFEDSSVDPFSSDPHEEDDLDWNRPAARSSGGLRQTRPEDGQPSSASQPRLNLREIQSDVDLNVPGPKPGEIAKLISQSDSFDSFDDLNDILGDGRALTPPPAQIPDDFRNLKPEDLGEARTLPLPEQLEVSEASTRRGSDRTQPLARSAFDPGLPKGEVPGDVKALAFERARLEDEVRRLRGALDSANKSSPEAVRIAANALRDQELGRLARRVADLESQVAGLKKDVQDREDELDAVTEDMIQKEDQIDTLTARLKRGDVVTPAHPTPLPQPSFDPGSEDFTSLEF